LKPEWWGSPLVQEKYLEEKACDKRHPYPIIKKLFTMCWNKSHKATYRDTGIYTKNKRIHIHRRKLITTSKRTLIILLLLLK
jgi:hypothetical protein